MRYEVLLDASHEEASTVLRPEVFYHPLRAEFDPSIADLSVVKEFAPGDCLVKFRMRQTKHLQKSLSLIGTATGHQTKRPELGTNFARVAVRRDFPQPGFFAFCNVPCDASRMMLVEDSGLVKARIGYLKPAEDPTKSWVIEIHRLQRVPSWVTALLPDTHRFKTEWVNAYKKSNLGRQVREGTARYQYTVVGLRKCQRGPPLLPVVSGEATEGAVFADAKIPYWVHSEKEGFSFSSYLRRFLAALREPAEVFDSLDGRYLVPYQACMHTSVWERVWPSIEAAFKEQRAAYRRLNGGSGAPTLVIGAEPRFLPNSGWPTASYGAEPRDWLGAQVHGTFLDFRKPRAPRSRCGSAPELPPDDEDGEEGE